MFNSPEIQTAMPTKYCLLTDDSPNIRKIVRRLLERMNFEIDEAENGRIALEKCGQRMPDVIMLDWNMPVMNGIEFLLALRASEGGAAPAVIFCTTECSVDHIRQAMDSGATEYLMKPFDAETLRAKLGSLVPASAIQER